MTSGSCVKYDVTTSFSVVTLLELIHFGDCETWFIHRYVCWVAVVLPSTGSLTQFNPFEGSDWLVQWQEFFPPHEKHCHYDYQSII